MDLPQVKAQLGEFFKYLIEINKPPYKDVDAWRAMSLTERLQNYSWTREIFLLVCISLYVFYYKYAKNYNHKLALKFSNSIKPLLQAQFAEVGVSKDTFMLADNPYRFTTYATGRANIESVLVRLRLKDRQNLVAQIGGIFSPSLGSPDGMGDHIDITITPNNPKKIENQIFAVINKESLPDAQREHYYLKHAVLNDHSSLPDLLVFMAEHNEQISMLVTEEFKNVLNLPAADKVLKLLSVSDVKINEPTTEEDLKSDMQIRLSFKFPKTELEFEACAKILEQTILLVDLLCTKQQYKVGAAKKIDNNRRSDQAIVAKIREEERRLEAEKRKAEERKQEAKREMQLSEREQRKRAKREQEKKARKQSKKMTARM